jgi:hypothetical protein
MPLRSPPCESAKFPNVIYDFGLFAIGKNGDGKVGARELKNKGRNSRQADKQVLCCISKERFDGWKRDT